MSNMSDVKMGGNPMFEAQPKVGNFVPDQSAGVKAMEVAPTAQGIASEVGNTPAFNLAPVAPGERFQCLLKREKAFGGPPTYFMYTPDGRQFLMAARRRRGMTSANYLISVTKNEIKKGGPTVIAKVRARDGLPVKSREYMVYTNGENPSKCEQEEKIRQELAFVEFDSKTFNDVNNPPKMRVIVPSVMGNGQPFVVRPESDDPNDSGSLQYLKDKTAGRQELTTLGTALPTSDPSGAFVLNFSGGRKSVPSVKNVALANEATGLPILTFGKVDKNDFLVEFEHPFSPAQAFGICLTLMDNNGATENY